jgi:hypothetical protein
LNKAATTRLGLMLAEMLRPLDGGLLGSQLGASGAAVGS